MKKKFLVLFLAVFMTVSVFAKGFTRLPTSGREIIVMQGNAVVWHAKNWSLEIDSVKYTDMNLWGSGGDDYFKIYTFRGTPTGEGNAPSKDWTEFSVIDCENLTWIFK